MDFGLAEGDADAEDGALTILPDPDGDENGAIQKLPALADLFVSGVQDHVGITSQRAITPGLEFEIELGGAGADLGRADGMAAEFLNDFGDFAGGDSLDIHLGEGEQEGFFAAGSFFESAGIKIHAVADLRNTEQEGANTGGEGFGFESIGTPQAILTTLVRAGLQDGGAFLDHGLVDEQSQALGKAGGTFGGEELQNGCQKLRINWVGHVCVFVGCVCCTPTGNHTGQPPANFAQAPSGAGCARLATLAFAPPPPEGALRSRRTQLQNKLYTGKPTYSKRQSPPTGGPNPSSTKCVPLAKKSFSNPLPEPVKNQAAKSSQTGLNLAPFMPDPFFTLALMQFCGLSTS